jgi:hypothetical protein
MMTEAYAESRASSYAEFGQRVGANLCSHNLSPRPSRLRASLARPSAALAPDLWSIWGTSTRRCAGGPPLSLTRGANGERMSSEIGGGGFGLGRLSDLWEAQPARFAYLPASHAAQLQPGFRSTLTARVVPPALEVRHGPSGSSVSHLHAPTKRRVVSGTDTVAWPWRLLGSRARSWATRGWRRWRWSQLGESCGGHSGVRATCRRQKVYASIVGRDRLRPINYTDMKQLVRVAACLAQRGMSATRGGPRQPPSEVSI